MKKNLTLLVTIIGSVTLTYPLYAADTVDRQPRMSGEQEKVVLVVDRNKLDGAPRPENLVSDDKFQRDLERYYGIAYSWQEDKDDKQNTMDKNRADKIRHNLKSDIDGDKLRKQDSLRQMDPDESNLKNEFRKLLLIFNPW
jgi:hypothetical protein